MNRTPTPILLFDIMDTLVVDPFFEQIPAYFGIDFQRLREITSHTDWVQFELGNIDETTFLDRVFTEDVDIDPHEFKRAFRHSYQWVEGMQNIVSQLHGHAYEIHAFSNYPVWYRMIDQKLCLSEFLSWSFVSCETGVRKPAPASYEHVLDVLEVPPDQILFVDNREANCEGARKFGIPSHVFEDAPGFTRWLQTREIL